MTCIVRICSHLQGKRTAIKYGAVDSTVSLGIAFFINAAILILAAAAFYYSTSEHREVATLTDAYNLLAPAVGKKAAKILFAVALLAAGQNSSITGTLAGQIVMEGFLHIRCLPAAALGTQVPSSNNHHPVAIQGIHQPLACQPDQSLGSSELPMSCSLHVHTASMEHGQGRYSGSEMPVLRRDNITGASGSVSCCSRINADALAERCHICSSCRSHPVAIHVQAGTMVAQGTDKKRCHHSCSHCLWHWWQRRGVQALGLESGHFVPCSTLCCHPLGAFYHITEEDGQVCQWLDCDNRWCYCCSCDHRAERVSCGQLCDQ